MATAAPVYSARPTVQVDGQQYALVRELMRWMEMHEAEGGLSRLELRLVNYRSRTTAAPGLAFDDGDVLKLGAAIAVYGGDEMGPTEIFRGLVTGLEAHFGDGAPELVVLAEDAMQRARMSRRSTTHESLTIQQLAARVAGAAGLTLVADGFTEEIGPQVQLNESDLGFLRRLLRRYDGDLQVVGDELHLSPRNAARRGTVTLQRSVELTRARVLADLAHQVSTVTVTGWDAAQGRRIRVTSQAAGSGPGQGKTGAELLAQTAFGRRHHHVGHLAVKTEAEARSLGDAIRDRRARGFVRLDAEAVGDPRIRVGTHVETVGLGNRFDNTYYVVEARHRFDGGPGGTGYVTEFSAETAYWGG